MSNNLWPTLHMSKSWYAGLPFIQNAGLLFLAWSGFDHWKCSKIDLNYYDQFYADLEYTNEMPHKFHMEFGTFVVIKITSCRKP